MSVGFLIAILILMIIVSILSYVFIGIFLNRLNVLINKKGSAMAWIPGFNIYLLGKLTINKFAGIIFMFLPILTLKLNMNINDNGDIKSVSILPEKIRFIYMICIGILFVILFIIALIKFIKLVKKDCKDRNVLDNKSLTYNQLMTITKKYLNGENIIEEDKNEIKEDISINNNVLDAKSSIEKQIIGN